MVRFDGPGTRFQHRCFDHELELAHVAVPAIGGHPLQRGLGEVRRREHLDEQPADLIAQISQCLAGRVTVPLDNVTSQTSFAELGVDSLSFLELIVDVEKEQ